MPRAKKFPCGHKGKGQYCHRCAAQGEAPSEAQLLARAKAKAKAKVRQAEADAAASQALVAFSPPSHEGHEGKEAKGKEAKGKEAKGKAKSESKAERKKKKAEAKAAAEAATKAKEAAAAAEAKAKWKAAFEDDPIDLRHLPNKGLVERARRVLAAVEQGSPWQQFRGKRLEHDRSIISVPLGRRYRILFRADQRPPKPMGVLSHEDYNSTKPGV